LEKENDEFTSSKAGTLAGARRIAQDSVGGARREKFDAWGSLGEVEEKKKLGDLSRNRCCRTEKGKKGR